LPHIQQREKAFSIKFVEVNVNMMHSIFRFLLSTLYFKMKKSLVILTVICLIPVLGFCQGAFVRGVITDTINRQNLDKAVVCLLRSKDSILTQYARSNEKGQFQISNIAPGQYILLVMCSSYTDYIDSLNLISDSIVNVGSIKLILKANLLQDVIVKQKLGSIRIKGDTTEFIADSFKVQQNATVEDLLKRLPGMQIDKNGNITAQGEKVQKVLVEGEEFFGDDPTLVTQNLRADIIASVQVYDKSSDQAAFTGIDDGKKQRTINLKIKENKKHGYFGKARLSAGTDGYHDNQAMLNIFNGKEKLAAYGIISNLGKTGLDNRELNSYASQNEGMSQGDEMPVVNSDDFDKWKGTYNGIGYPLVKTGGLHYNTKWAYNKQIINGNYKILNLIIDGSSTRNMQNILSHDSINYSNSHQQFKNSLLRNSANAAYEIYLDSFSSIKVAIDAGTDHKLTAIADSSASMTNNMLVNRSIRNLSGVVDKGTLNNNIIFKKRFKKAGRTVVLNIGDNYLDNKSNGYLYNIVDTFNNNIPAGQKKTDQYKQNTIRNVLINARLVYTEPLSATSTIAFNYGISIDNSNSKKNSFNKNSQGKYEKLDSLYSNYYQFNIFTNKGGVAYSFVKKKLSFDIGTDVGYANFTQTDLYKDTADIRKFINWYPYANLTFILAQRRRLYISYTGNTLQPSIQQLQPVATNDDPLNVIIGNATLSPEFDNEVNVKFTDYKVLTERSFFGILTYRSIKNAISNKIFFDVYGKQINQFVNLNGNHSFSVIFNYGIKLKKLDSYFNIGANIDAFKTSNIVNNILNITRSNNFTSGISFNKDKQEKFSFALQLVSTYTTSASTIQRNLKTSFWTYKMVAEGAIYLPYKLQLHGDMDYAIRQKIPGFVSNKNIFLLNGRLEKKIMKDNSLSVGITANDILNQNQGFNRSVSSNFITQSTNSTIARYFMLSIVWNFNKAIKNK